ncbi:hypothetical protein HGP14_05615 [Rhizobium sp. P32RR-XVIII]|uniref:hypothetical protein n=1 Tax=Rhizobium sp. P32RR-XVIII TaxID=2726738 RepID=UPI001456BDFB|nr:hypothetical protein [Rhizobium sp. P32RR-XVIII]NLS02849.1 hypothetical protein [Rhizobium sp. P32RR-XVIII]
MAYDEFEIDRIKHALGDMCTAWAHLEEACFSILFFIMGTEDTAYQLIRNELDFRRAIQVCKGHAVANHWHDHCDHIPVLVDMIDGDIRVNRNRYVHDPIYYYGSESFERHTYKTRFKKVPFNKLEILLGDYAPISSDEIYALSRAIRALENYAGSIIQFYDWLEGEEDYLWGKSMASAQLSAYFAISEYTQLTKSRGSAG